MASTSDPKPIYRVAVLLFPQADILDYAGPTEVLSNAGYSQIPDDQEPIFAIDTAGRAEDAPIPTGSGSLSIQPSIDIKKLLDTLPEFHVLIVPGGPFSAMERVLGKEDGLELEVVRAFAKLPSTADGQERIILSVCTGAFLLGAAGVLSGLRVTTHHLGLDRLKTLCDESDARNGVDPKTEVVGGQRFIDAGLVKDGLRIVTAGGVTSGLDAALHLVELVKDRETADFGAKLIEYERRQI